MKRPFLYWHVAACGSRNVRNPKSKRTRSSWYWSHGWTSLPSVVLSLALLAGFFNQIQDSIGRAYRPGVSLKRGAGSERRKPSQNMFVTSESVLPSFAVCVVGHMSCLKGFVPLRSCLNGLKPKEPAVYS